MDKTTRLNALAKEFLSEYLVCICIILLAIVTIIVQPRFLSWDNLVNIIRQFGPLSLVSLGMTFVILAGYLDLSISGTFSLVTVVTVHLITPFGQILALVAGLLLGIATGALSGTVIRLAGANRRSEALFVSFGLSLAYGALALMISGGKTQRLPAGLKLYEAIGSGGIGIISYTFILFLICMTLLYILQSKTYIGRTIMLTGGNPDASRLAGLPVNVVPILVYSLSGLMTALGSIVLFSRVTTASPTIGVGYDTNAITAVLIGGTSLLGGKGSVLRTAIGVVLITLLSNCMNLLGVTSYMQNVVKGAILIFVIWLDTRKSM